MITGPGMVFQLKGKTHFYCSEKDWKNNYVQPQLILVRCKRDLSLIIIQFWKAVFSAHFLPPLNVYRLFGKYNYNKIRPKQRKKRNNDYYNKNKIIIIINISM